MAHGIMTARDGRIVLEVHNRPGTTSAFDTADAVGIKRWVTKAQGDYGIREVYNLATVEDSGLEEADILSVFHSL